MEQIIFDHLITVICSLLAFGVGSLWRSYKDASRKNDEEEEQDRKDRELLKEGVCVILRWILVHKCEKCLEGGYCTVKYRQDIQYIFKVYTLLGGNDIIPELVKKVQSLPIEQPEVSHG